MRLVSHVVFIALVAGAAVTAQRPDLPPLAGNWLIAGHGHAASEWTIHVSPGPGALKAAIVDSAGTWPMELQVADGGRTFLLSSDDPADKCRHIYVASLATDQTLTGETIALITDAHGNEIQKLCARWTARRATK